MKYSETEIFRLLDLAFIGEINEFYPTGNSEDIKYNFFLDLEHGYCETAGSKIHLYADEQNWAIVFEKSGYFNRAERAEIELNYIGNCIEYSIESYPERNYISNATNIILIDNDEFERIVNSNLDDGDNFELIGKNIEEIKIKGMMIPFNNIYKDYEKVGIEFSDDGNFSKLIRFGDLIRFLNETNPSVISASEEDIKKHIPDDLPKLITIEHFHFSSAYDRSNPPSEQELFQLIAKIVVEKNSDYWNPSQQPNNNWKNWESGNL
ncbi:hypothetical protein D3C87_537740 [compost metagenome]